MSDQSLKLYALRSELTLTHYRLLMRVEAEAARTWYMDEAAGRNWSTRALERQINTFTYERILASKNKKGVKKEWLYEKYQLSHEVVF